jgi:carboxyl-terminal processing protease
MLFNDHLATSEQALVSAFTTLQAANVTDLVLDIRYNGGGYLDIASEVAYMIAGPTATAGKTFELTQFNSKHPTVDPVAGGTITPTLFESTTQGFSTTSGQPLPT